MASMFLSFSLFSLIGLNYCQNVPNINITSLPTLFPTVLASLTTTPTQSPSISPTEFIIPPTDIGCNYVNLGGVASPMDYCMHVEPPGQRKIVHIKFNCNSLWTKVNLEVYTDPECAHKPIFVSDFSDQIIDFFCDPNYKFKTCDEVSIKGYPTDSCSGDIFSEIRLITESCIPNGNGTFDVVECTESTLTVQTYTDIPIEKYGTCDEEYLYSSLNIEDQSATLDGDRAGCVAVEGCGDYASEHEIIDIGCNYVNFNGFAIPMDYCMAVKTDDKNYSYKVYCDETWNKLMFGYYTFNRECTGTAIKELDVSSDFQYVCDKEYADVSCEVMELRSYLDNTCSGSEYYDLVFITDVCIYDDTDIYYKMTCDSHLGILSMYQTIDDECTDNNLVNTKLMQDEIEVWDMVFGCSEVTYCAATDYTTIKPDIIMTDAKMEKMVDGHKGWIMMTIVAVGSIAGLIVLIIALFSLHRYCKQKKEVENMVMAQSHSGKNVNNPYGHIEHDVMDNNTQGDGNQNVTETDNTLLNE